MKAYRLLARPMLGLMAALLLVLPVAADTDVDAPVPEEGLYCFSREELDERAELTGIFFTEVPAEGKAQLRLGSRVLRVGDAISRADLSRLMVEPQGGGDIRLCFLPFENGHLGEEATLTFHFETVEDVAPAGENSSIETWRNLPNTGKLKATGTGELTFRLENRPRRGTVELNGDGSFTYTPRKNKVGEDSFTFTVTDAAGRVSAPATVLVTIRKPTDAQTFADLDRDEQFEALWMREAGLFGGELISDRLSFGPEQPVNRGDFLAMVMDLEGIEPEIGLQVSGFADEAEAASWLRPYLASALRRGLIQGETTPAGLVFRPNEPITQAEAAALVARARGEEELLSAARTDVPDTTLTRKKAAEMLYAAYKG
ncbi:MAG: S-layer homology domain-containing protein [Oscillospiraceae bacterium]|nr:S-layer homology domain-containing protein [Oscillospiraceae bacterium]